MDYIECENESQKTSVEVQDCFECTDWDMFREAATNGEFINLEEYTSTVTSYIGKCIDDVTTSKTITICSNQKPWMTAKVRALLKTRDSAFRAGDKTALKTARAKLSRAIREAKHAHAKRIHGHFQDSGDTRRMWQGIQAITNYKTTSPACDRDAPLPDALNDFYARFEVQNNVVARKTIPPPSDQTTTIFPVPKKSTVSCLNDYRPVALTPIMMKCFERLVMRHIKTQLPPSLDPMQFAYRPNRSTDDAISTTLHLALTHLKNKDSYVRMLFIDFSSAFNTIIPQHLIEKLRLLGLNTSLCNWILDFLTERPQSVRIGNSISSTTTLSTGAPQGCVLSPLLFTLLTHDCAPTHSLNHIIKFADDTTVVGLISKNDESAYREEVQRLTAWCGANNLSLNVDKTKEMVVDFRRAQSDHSPLIIDGSSVEIVKSTKFLGVHLADDLTWSLNTSSITKKAQQRLYFLRRLRKAHLPPPILTMFYRGTIESIDEDDKDEETTSAVTELDNAGRSTEYIPRDLPTDEGPSTSAHNLSRTWLNPPVPDHAIQPAEFFSVYHMDRTLDSGKSRGGGVCLVVNNHWCDSTSIVPLSCSCTPNLELLTIKCRPLPSTSGIQLGHSQCRLYSTSSGHRHCSIGLT
ncbi:gastrula zinc finger protein XlCGF28.1-like [Silurus asotus]|uniref:Gastrula zinc finger protein XlCGF28.1-like n=1 Tax=Silurus asotus TaxID=30991 RepID=A0AAD5B8Q9_SILAS|nr:gastrula zinc finger protein XlCGF28.1-like [Silurus asotus]